MNFLRLSSKCKIVNKCLIHEVVSNFTTNSLALRTGRNLNLNTSLLRVSKSTIFHQQNVQLSTSNRRIFFSWKSFFISGTLLALFGGTLLYLKEEKMKKMEKQRKKALGQAAIGGKFDLIDHNGKRFTSYDLEGKWVLLYFGFTHCPDVCPDELEKLINAVEIIEGNKNADQIQPVFITVDPDRDDVAAVREYIQEFSPKFIGLTGTKEQINQATRSYRVYYSAGPRDHENDYIVDHTIITYLIDPEGNMVDYYGQTKTAEDVANGVVKSMQKYRKMNSRLGFL
ncbi:hypothetical protein RDWZM_007355 [Blomia tropicalis]|uniref:Thioredoxin domain-containing protein n=1 Tax=Blomia tropicalis TaxID=40697 RepID=A0A9Q0LX94_BLOTA|nr:hypothetical protein RDWZM_007355 [Blomia tropicalis]